MLRKKIKNKSEDTFFVSWSDMVALLLVLFAYIISISTIDQTKLTSATESFQKGLTQSQDIYLGQEKLENLYEKLQKMIKSEHLEEDLSVIAIPNGISIELGQNTLFNIGEARLKPEARPVLKQIADSLHGKNISVDVEGHTDDIPIHNEEFHSNWHLSASRASEVLVYLNRYGIEESKLKVSGYAMTRPQTANTSSENRALNRRVTLRVISRSGG